ncbi:MAG TPA: hypothetical protein PKD54_04410, partial [Pirellulaceae bacterium]|nr:hypothetical protein [Pirellulaceae bacterium]
MNENNTASSTRRCRAFQLSFTMLGFWSMVWAPAIVWGQSTSIDWMDFESPGLASQWQARGSIQLSRDDVPPDVPQNGPQGKMLTLTAEGRAMALTRHDTWPLPTKVDQCESLTFWVRNLDPLQQPLVFDILFPESDLRGAFWRKVEVTSNDWQLVRVPFQWMRWETGRVPQWNQVSSFAIRTRGPAKFCIDQIVFHDDDVLQFADYSVEDLASLAFGQNRPAARVVEEAGFWLLTDELQLDVQALQARLSEVLAAMQHDLALADGPLPRLIVFSRDADYRRFVVRFAERLGASASAPASDGYHLQGIALSSWDAAQGSLRP